MMKYCTAALFLCLNLGLAAAADPSLTNLVMPDAKVIAGIDFERLKTAPFGQYLLGQLKGREAELDKLMAATGFDPRRDLHEVIIASPDVQGAAMGRSSNAMVIVRGAFDAAKLASLGGMFGGTMTEYNGARLLSAPAGAGEQPHVGILSNALILGPQAAVKGALDRNRSAARLSAAFAERVAQASSRYDVWFVTTVSPSALAGTLDNPNMSGAMKGDLIQGIESVFGGLKFGSNVEIGGEAVARSEKDATALVDVARFFVSMAQSSGSQAPRAGSSNMASVMSMLDTLKMTAEGRTVRFSFTAPEQDFEKLFAPGVNRVRKKAGSVTLD